MYFEIIKTLKKYGFKHYEISNFSKKGYESNHNLTYWNNNEYYGFGTGASGYISDVRYDNTKSVLNYIHGKTRVFEEKIDLSKKMKDDIMLLLRTKKGINKKEFLNKYKINIESLKDIKELLVAGYLKENKRYIFIKEKYYFISNEIIIKILESI